MVELGEVHNKGVIDVGMRFRKSIKLGKHVRINLSKSGVGYSVGTKGYRVTKMANGRTRTTVSIPGTGISHVSERKSAYTSSIPRSSSLRTCVFCDTLLSPSTSYCPKCGLDVRPVTSYIHPAETKKKKAYTLLLCLSTILFIIFLFPLLTLGSYSTINYSVVIPIAAFSSVFLILTIVFFILMRAEESRISREYEKACKIEIDRRASLLQEKIDEQKKFEEARIEELRRKKEEQERLAADESRRRAEEQRRSTEESRLRHEEFVQSRIDGASNVLNNIPLFPVSVSPVSCGKDLDSLPDFYVTMNKLMSNTRIDKLTDYVAFDAETIRSEDGSSRLTHIAAIRFVDFRPVSLFVSPINPDSDSPSSPNSSPKFHQISNSLIDFLGKSTLVGHSLYIDLSVLHKYGFIDSFKSRSHFDVIDIARSLDSDADSFDLRTLCRRYTFHYPEFNRKFHPLAIGYLFNIYVRQKHHLIESEYPALFEWK